MKLGATFLLFACLCTFRSAAGGTPTWRALPNAPPANAGRFEDIHFADDVTGWLVSFDGEVWKTSNGGISWSAQIDTLESFRSVTFTTPQRGWVGSVFDINLLFETWNGGETWSVVPNIPEPRPAGLCALFAVNESVVYGCGRYLGPARVIKTTDGGTAWTSQDLAPLADTLVDCHFVSPDSGFVVGGVGTFPNTETVVLSTGDGGASWQTRFQGTMTGEWGWKISFPTPEIGYVSIEEFSSISQYLKSTDGGVTWTTHSFLPARQQGVGFVDADNGWLGGGESVTYRTTNGGETWQPETWGDRMNRIVFLRGDLGYAVGRSAYKYSVDPVPTAAPAPMATPVFLGQNSPNPFNPTTVIRYYLDDDGPVRLRVFNASGALVKILKEEYLPPGDYTVEWDGRDEGGSAVASGLYFYRLDTGTFAEVRKMVLVR